VPDVHRDGDRLLRFGTDDDSSAADARPRAYGDHDVDRQDGGGEERDEELRLPPFSDWYRVRLDYLETNPGHGDFEAILARTKRNGKASLTREELRRLEPSLNKNDLGDDIDDDLAQSVKENVFRSMFRRVRFEDGVGGGLVYTTISPASRQLCSVKTLAGDRVTRRYAIVGE
jgi:hypothetical protein